MDIVSYDSLCLKSIDYKDDDKLITLYCAEKGKITAVAKGVKKPKAKLKFCASPMCFGKYYLCAKSGRYTVTGCDVIDGFFSITENIVKFYCAGCILEVLDKFSPEGDFNLKLFTYSLTTLNTIAYKSEEKDCEVILTDYLKGCTTLLGFGNKEFSLRQFNRFFIDKLETKINSLDQLTKLL